MKNRTEVTAPCFTSARLYYITLIQNMDRSDFADKRAIKQNIRKIGNIRIQFIEELSVH